MSFFQKLKENSNNMFRKMSNDTNRFFNKTAPSIGRSFLKGADWVANTAKTLGSDIERRVPQIANILGAGLSSFGAPEIGMLVSQAGNQLGAMGNQYGQIGNKIANTSDQLKMVR